MSVSGFVVVGAGGMGREAMAWAADAFPTLTAIGYLDDNPALLGASVNGVPVVGAMDWLIGRDTVGVVLAIGAPDVRRDVFKAIATAGHRPLTVVHPSATVGSRTFLGSGVIICPHAFVSIDVKIGDGVIVNYGACVGHDSKLGPYASIGPGVNLAGGVTVGEGATVGIGASVIQQRRIGNWARIGAGAAVVVDVPEGATFVGVPAHDLAGRTP